MTAAPTAVAGAVAVALPLLGGGSGADPVAEVVDGRLRQPVSKGTSERLTRISSSGAAASQGDGRSGEARPTASGGGGGSPDSAPEPQSPERALPDIEVPEPVFEPG